MDKCFVIQPFDGGKFDKRFDDVLSPAIKTAKLDPYRVDRDPSVSIPIEEIENGIQSSRVCLADISTDNPNVWFELGYAIASQREVVLICSEERTTKFPFDVQHRSIIKYKTESPSDFLKLQEAITARLLAIIHKEGQLNSLAKMSPVASVEGLEQYEIAALVAAAQQVPDPDDTVTPRAIQDDMERAGFTPLAATMGIRELLDKYYLESLQLREEDGTPYVAYHVTHDGMRWLYKNTARLNLTGESKRSVVRDGFPDDEIPF